MKNIGGCDIGKEDGIDAGQERISHRESVPSGPSHIVGSVILTFVGINLHGKADLAQIAQAGPPTWPRLSSGRGWQNQGRQDAMIEIATSSSMSEKLSFRCHDPSASCAAQSRNLLDRWGFGYDKSVERAAD